MKANHHIILSFLFVLLFVSCSTGATKASNETINTVSKVTEDSKLISVNHSVFNNLLQSYVSNTGNVNYTGLVKDKSKLKN